MNKLSTLFFIAIAAFVWQGCSDDEEESELLEALFEVSVTGESPDAVLTLTNNTPIEANVDWTFTKGVTNNGSPYTTTGVRDPTGLIIHFAGDITITLTATRGDQTDTKSQTITVGGETAVKTSASLEFAVESESSTYGRFFIVDELGRGEVHFESEISDFDGPYAVLAFANIGTSVLYFESPDSPSYNITDAINTKVMNFVTTEFSLDDFFTIENGSSFESVSVTNDDESFGSSSLPRIVLFETSDGRKGAVHVRSVDSEKVMADIRMTEY